MVAIFTGAGFGFERGSASVLGGSGLLGSEVQGWGGEGVFVNAANGNLLLQKQDEFLVGRGPDVTVARTYNSLTTLADDNNDKWRQSTDRRVYGLAGTLNTAGSTVKRVSGDGAEIVYTWDASVSAYITKDGGGAYDKITKSGAEWVWTDGDTQSVERYADSGAGKIKSLTDRNGVALTFSYDGSARLDKVTSSDGAWIRYDYSGATNNITQIVTGYTDLATSTAKTLTRTRYGYDGSNRLSTVTVDLTPDNNSVADGATYVTTYGYDGAGRVSSIAQGDGSNLAITYDGSGRVATLAQTETVGVTRTTSLSYGTLYTSVTDPSGQVTRLDYDAAGNLSKITAPPAYSGAAQQIVQFGYNANGDLTSTTDALGQVTTFGNFTANGLAQTITDRLGNGVTRTYSAANLLLSETRTGIDATGSAVSQTARYVHDAAGSLRFAISAEGRVTEYTRNSAGEVTYETVYAEAAYTAAGTPSVANMTSWVGGLPNKSWVQKTKYLYDARGAVQSVTTYGIANAAGTEQTSDGASVTSFVYDQAGQLLSSYSGANTATSYVYDGMGRVVSTTDGNGGTTTIAFNSASLTTTVTLASGYVTTKTYNKAGDLVSVTDSGSNTVGGTTSYAYDKLGRVRVRTDAEGLKTYTLYDNAGRHVGDVDHAGYLTEYFYDANNRLVGTVGYHVAIGIGALAGLGTPTTAIVMASIRPAANAEDTASWVIYDAEGRVRQTIAGDGSTTISTYDAAGRLQKTTAYVNKIPAGTVVGYVTSPPTAVVTPTANAGDAVTRNFYDKDGLLLGALSGEGYLTRNEYDRAGQLVATTSFANATTVGLRATGSFNALVSSVGTGAHDRTSRFVYDGQGLLRYEIDPLGQVVRYDYDAAGQKVRTALYAAALGATADYTYDSVKALAAGLEASSAKRVSYAVYDAAGRMAYGIEASGAVTSYSYDTSARVTKTVEYAATYSAASLPPVATMNTWAAGQAGNGGNRITRSWYTARGEAAYVIDADGNAMEYGYDAKGQLTATIEWLHPITATDSTTLAQVTGALTGGVIVDLFWYDSLGRLAFSVDPAGVRTTYAYHGTTNLKTQVIRVENGTAQERTITHTLHDSAGRVIQTIDAEGTAEAATNSQAWDGRGNLASSTDPRVKTTTYTYDLDGRVKTVTDAAGGVTSYEYNAFGEVWKTTDPKGNVSYAWYDKLGRITTSRDAAGYLTQTAYTTFGEIASVRRWMAAVGGTPSMATEPVGTGTVAITWFAYDAAGRVTSTMDARGNTENFTYNAFGDRITSTNKLNSTTSYAYDRLGRLVRQGVAASTHIAGSTTATTVGSYIVTTYAYDTGGRRSEMKEGYAAAALTGTVTALRTTKYEYDGLDRLTKVIHDAVSILESDNITLTAGVVPAEEYVYDKRGNIILVKDAQGIPTMSYYDDLDRKIVEIKAKAMGQWAYTAYVYDANGNLTSAKVYEANAHTTGDWPVIGGIPPAPPAGLYRETAFTYDNLNRQVSSAVVSNPGNDIVSGYWNGTSFVTSTGNLVTTYQYDANGNAVKTTDPNGKVTWSWYDSLNRKTAQLDGEKYLMTWTYDAEGNVLRETRFANGFTGTPSLASAPTVATNGNDRITDFEYDLAGNRTKETRRNVVAWTVDIWSGNLSAASTTDSVIEYTYNALGQVTLKKVIGLNVAEYFYDGVGRLYSEKRGAFNDAADQLVTPEKAYWYDALGNLVRNIEWGSGATGTSDRTTAYSYAQGGRLLTMTDAGGNTHSYAYDVVGRQRRDLYQRQVNANNSASDGTVNTIAEAKVTVYDLSGRVNGQGVYSTVGGTFQGVDFISFRYNNFDQVTQQGEGMNGAGVMLQAENRYDAAGRLVASNADDGSWKAYAYDRAGNQTAVVATLGAAAFNRDVTIGGALYYLFSSHVNGTFTVYDGRNQATQVAEEGRELSATVGNQTLNTYRSYNAFGEIASETNALGSTVTYTYNTMGRKLRSESPAVQITLETGVEMWVKPAEDYYYDLGGRQVAVRDANGTYGSTGNTQGTAYSKAANTGNLTAYWLLGSTGLDGDQALVAVEYHADGGRKSIGYDRMGDARVIRGELYNFNSLHIEERTYNRLGQLVTVKHNRVTDTGDDSNRLIDNYEYDLLGQRIKHWNNQNYTYEKTQYDALGRVTAQTDFADYVTTTTYNWDGGLLTSMGGVNHNFGGWVETTTYANGRTSVGMTDFFGREVYKKDLGNNEFWSAYDWGGLLTSRTGQAFTWYNTGLVATVTTTTGWTGGMDWSTKVTTYGYDRVGNRTSEYMRNQGSYSTIDFNTNPSSQTAHAFNDLWVDQTATYDALGRVTAIYSASTANAGSASIAYKYDGVGNIRRTISSYSNLDNYGNGSGQVSEDLWYRYDSMSRLVTDRGYLWAPGTAWAQIVRAEVGGTDIAYNAAGQRTSAARTEVGYYDANWIWHPGTYRETRDVFGYDGAGRLIRIGQSQGTMIDQATYDAHGHHSNAMPSAPGGATDGIQMSTFTYDRLGRQLTQNDYAFGVYQTFSRTASYNAIGNLTNEQTVTVRQDGTFVANSSYVYTSQLNTSWGEYLLGAAGMVTTSNTRNGISQPTSRSLYGYAWRDGPLQSYISHQPNIGSATTHYTTFNYAADGALSGVNINDGRPRQFTYRTNADGQIIRRDEAVMPSYVQDPQTGLIYYHAPVAPNPHEAWYRFGGREWGYVTNNKGTDRMTAAASIGDRVVVPGTGAFRNGASGGTAYAEFTNSYDAINSYNQGSASGNYTVRTTGETLAQIAHSLWGDASLWYKLAEANGLTVDTNLVEGQRLTVPPGVMRSAYNASTVKPYDPADAIGNVSPSVPKPPKKKKGGGFFGFLLAIIAIAVAAIVAPQLIAAATNLLAGPTAVAAAATAGTAITGAATAGGAILGGAAAGALGSVVSQGIGVMTGIQEKFSWKGVALSALSGAVGGGAASVFGKGAMLGSQAAGDAIRGVASSALAQGIGGATGLQDKFNWAGIAAAGIGAGVGLQVAKELGRGSGVFANGLGNQLASSGAALIANAATRSAIEGSNFGDNILAGLPDTIGNTVGNLMADRISRSSPKLGYADVGTDGGGTGHGDENASPLSVGAGGGQVGRSSGAANGRGAVLSEWDNSAPGVGEPARQYVDTTGDIVIEAVNRPDHSDYWRSVTGGYSLSSYTPSLWMGVRQAVWGRQHQAYAQWSGGGLGYVAAPVTFGLSPVTGLLDLGSSFYRGRNGWVAPADRETTDISLIGIGGVETMVSKVGRLGAVGTSGGLEATYQARYAAAYERGVVFVDNEIAAGRMAAAPGQPVHLYRAGQVDSLAREDLKLFAEMRGHGSDVVRINQRLYLEGASGKYRVPDLYFPQSRTIFDGTLGTKTLNTPQIIDFRAATGNVPIGIVRPQSYGGSYWLGQ